VRSIPAFAIVKASGGRPDVATSDVDRPPSASDSTSGSIRVAGIDFEIFSPRTVHQPCAKIPSGSGSFAAIRNAGQYTV